MSILNTISVIVELGINHGGSLGVAKEMARTAIDNGAKFIKHQTHIPDEEMSEAAITPAIYDLIEKCTLSEAEEIELQAYTESLGAVFFSTPFCKAAVDRLERFNVPLYKIASGASDELIDYIASRGKPVILSTGMCDLGESARKAAILEDYAIPFAVLHTTSIYPTPPDKVNLGAIAELKTLFPLVGYSDHTASNHACFGAVSLGAEMVERHFKLSGMEGPAWSMDPEELKDLIKGVELIKELRSGRKQFFKDEEAARAFAHYSVVAREDIPEGTIITEAHLTLKRPGIGFPKPDKFLGLLAKRDIPRDKVLDLEDVGSH